MRRLSKKALEIRREFAVQWIHYSEALDVELRQARDEGRELPDTIEAEIEAIGRMDDFFEKELAALKLMERIQELPYRADYPYVEPAEYDEIRAECKGTLPTLPPVDKTKCFDKIYGAILGRCAGNMLGQPVEGWYASRIQGFMHKTGNAPITNYFRSDVDESIREEFGVSDDGYTHQRPGVNWLNNTTCAPEDDDIDFTLLGLRLLEEVGPEFEAEDVALNWLYNFPLYHTAVSERIGYRNIVNKIPSTKSGRFANPHRETLGGQIRVDAYGYVCPGDPVKAAAMAWKDATMTNDKNGIYGAMYIAAMLALVAVLDDPRQIAELGLTQIPARSRLYEGVRQVLQAYDEGKSADEVLAMIHTRFDERDPYQWVHAVGNTMVVVTGFLYGGGDLGEAIGTAVKTGYDTDCDGASVGSLTGMLVGAKNLPQSWLQGINNTVKTCVAGFDDEIKLDEFARRMTALVF